MAWVVHICGLAKADTVGATLETTMTTMITTNAGEVIPMADMRQTIRCRQNPTMNAMSREHTPATATVAAVATDEEPPSRSIELQPERWLMMRWKRARRARSTALQLAPIRADIDIIVDHPTLALAIVTSLCDTRKAMSRRRVNEKGMTTSLEPTLMSLLLQAEEVQSTTDLTHHQCSTMSLDLHSLLQHPLCSLPRFPSTLRRLHLRIRELCRIEARQEGCRRRLGQNTMEALPRGILREECTTGTQAVVLDVTTEDMIDHDVMMSHQGRMMHDLRHQMDTHMDRHQDAIPVIRVILDTLLATSPHLPLETREIAAILLQTTADHHRATHEISHLRATLVIVILGTGVAVAAIFLRLLLRMITKTIADTVGRSRLVSRILV